MWTLSLSQHFYEVQPYRENVAYLMSFETEAVNPIQNNGKNLYVVFQSCHFEFT